jgi:hypothetical protein
VRAVLTWLISNKTTFDRSPLGFELFRRFAVRIAYGAERLTMIDPAHFARKDAGIAVPFRFYDHVPQVQGRFGDIPGRFDIDTGSRVEVTLTKPFVEAHHLRDAYPQGIVAVDGWGVGGPVLSYIARAPSLTLGAVTVPVPVASMAMQNKGSFSDANYEGNVGSGLLKRFVVTFDYAHATMYLKPLAQPPADAGTFDRAGLWINLGDKGFDIVKITENGPAAQAGLTVGDRIVAIGDDAAAALSLSDARRVFRTMPVGKAVSIAYWRGGEVRKAILLPRDQIPGAVPQR